VAGASLTLCPRHPPPSVGTGLPPAVLARRRTFRTHARLSACCPAGSAGFPRTAPLPVRLEPGAPEPARGTSWDRPRFANGLYLGSFDLRLIHPWPQAPADDVERGEAFMARLTDYCRTMSGRTIERDARIPDEYLKGLAALGVFGMKIPRDYGGLGLSLVYYGRALSLLGSVHPSLGPLPSPASPCPS